MHIIDVLMAQECLQIKNASRKRQHKGKTYRQEHATETGEGEKEKEKERRKEGTK